jgi:archaetidylinositol phosphate synthase
VPFVATHRREHRSILADPEKRLLIWIARRLPPEINSDHLSLLGLGSILAVGAGFAAMRLTVWGALVIIMGLVGNWFGDSLDGTVARVRGQERPRFGYYVDHVIDLAGSAAVFAGLACSGLMTPLVAAAVLAGYLLVSAEVYLSTHVGGVFRMSAVGVGPTELRMLLIVGVLFAIDRPLVMLPFVGAHLLFDVGGVVALAGFVTTFIVATIRQTRLLYLAEPKPQFIEDWSTR